MSRHTVAAWICLAAPLSGGCTQQASHAPVAARLVRKLENHRITKAEFLRSLARVDAGIRQNLPVESVTVPFEFRSHTPVIQAWCGQDRPVSMLIDTGAARTVLSARSAVLADVPTISPGEVKATLQGVVGQEQGLVGMVQKLRLGGWVVPAQPCFVRTFESTGEGISLPDNILGFDLISRHCSYLTLDYPKRQVTFGFRESYQGDPGRHPRSAPFRLREGVASIDLACKGVKWSCILDSGSFNGVEISESVARRLGVQDQGEVVQGLLLVAVGGAVTSDHVRLRTVHLPELALLGGSYPDVEVDISPGMPRLGSHFLRDYKTTLDFRRMRVWLEH